MNLQGNFSNLHRILRSPDGAEGGITAAAEADNEAMSGALAVLNQRGLGMELEEPTAEQKAAGERKSKEQTKVDEWKDDEEEEEGGEKQEAESGKQKKGKEKEQEKTEGTEKGPSAEEIVEATQEWQDRIAELERRAGQATTEEAKAELAQELATAKTALAAWEAEAAGAAAGGEGPDVETVATVKAELTKVQEEKAQMAAKVQELEAQGTPGLSVENIHPLMFTEKPEEIAALDRKYAEFEMWAMEHLEGIEEEKDEHGKVTQRGFTGQQIRRRLAEVSEERKSVIPAARQALAYQAQAREQARTVYPELFDPKRPEAKAAENILRAVPALKAMFPNVWVIIGDALVGERLRLEKGKKNGAGGNGGNGRNGPRRPLPRVARGGGAGVSAAAGGAGGREAKRKLVRANGGIDPEKFMEGGGDRKALIASIS